MAVTSQRLVTNIFSGDIVGRNDSNAAENAVSPGKIDIVTLSAGANTITPPGGGSTPVGVTIIPPAGNTTLITLKGISGDTGIELHNTDPTSLGLNSPTNTFVLTAAAQIVGVRLIWS